MKKLFSLIDFRLILFFFAGLILTACGKKTQETTPVKKDITEMIFASGTLEPDNKYILMAQADGYIATLNFEEGQILKTGAVIGYIDNKANVTNADNANAQLTIAQTFTTDASPALQQIAANIIIAKQKLAQEKIQYERYQKLNESNSVSKLEFENAQLTYNTAKENLAALQNQYDNTKRVAEQQYIAQRNATSVNSIAKGYNQLIVLSGGKVYKKHKEIGDYVRKGDPIATIGSSDFLYAKLNVDESSIGAVKLGQSCLISLNTAKSKLLHATIYEINPAFDEPTQSFICKAKFDTTLQFNIAGTQLEANIIGDTIRQAMVIPKIFLQSNSQVQIKGEKQLTPVKTGFVSTEWVQIVSGLKGNETLVTDKVPQ